MDLKVNSVMRSNVPKNIEMKATSATQPSTIFDGVKKPKGHDVDPENILIYEDGEWDVITDYPNPEAEDEFYTINGIASLLVQEGPDALKNFKGIKLTTMVEGNMFFHFIDDEFLITYKKGTNTASIKFTVEGKAKFYEINTDEYQ